MYVVIGNSPATAMCAIYLKTANLPVKVIKNSSIGLKFKATVLPGYDKPIENFLDDCFSQAEFVLGDHFLTSEKITSVQCGSVCVDGTSHCFSHLILDTPIPSLDMEFHNSRISIIKTYLENEESLYDDKYYEAMILAGTGCKLALDIIHE